MLYQGFLILAFSLVIAFFLSFIVFVSTSKAKTRRKLSRTWTALLVGLGSFFLCSIGGIMYLFQGPPTPVKQPSNQDLVGIWILAKESEEDLAKSGVLPSTHQIILSDDGSCKFTRIPELSEGKIHFLTGKGRWDVEKDTNNDWVLVLSVLHVDSTEQEMIVVNISGKRPPFTLTRRLYHELSAWVFEKQ